jgi:DegV family protein with EDD domain
MTNGVVTDSTCDLPESMVASRGIRVIPQYLHIGEHSYPDGVELSRRDFYRKLAESEAAVSTAAAGPHVFRKACEELAEAGASQVLSIHVTERLSGTIGVARLAAHETKTVSVHVFDSRQLSLGTGILVQTAAETASEGMSLEGILTLLDEQIRRTHVFAALDTLDFLQRGDA